MNKILCPVDFSDTSLNAIQFAVEIGRKFHSRLTLLHVFTEKNFEKVIGESAVGKSSNELLSIANDKLRSLAHAVDEQVGNEELAECDFIIEMGVLVDKINEVSKSKKYDLIVMGTTGISRVNGVFFGSNTQDVMERVQKPVLCIPDMATYSGIKKIIYASDFMKEDRVAIQQVISIATMFNARIKVVHINTVKDSVDYKAFIDELKSFITYEKISFLNASYDDVATGLNDCMREEKGDILSVFRRERGFIASIFGTSLTKNLSFSSNKPLLVLKLNEVHEI